MQDSLRVGHEAGIVCADEYLLHPDPFLSREAWGHSWAASTEQRLTAVAGRAPADPGQHWPLVREPTRVMTHQQFPRWCGTGLAADWHIRFVGQVVVYGHLRIPRTTTDDGARFRDVSIGYPRELQRSGLRVDLARLILPETAP